LSEAAKYLVNCHSTELSGIIGEFADIESIVALKDLLNRFDCDNFELRNTGVPHLNADFRSSYLMNSNNWCRGSRFIDTHRN